MNVAKTVKWVGKLTIMLSTLAVLVSFVFLPNTPPSGWGWAIFALALLALGGVLASYRLYRRSGQSGIGNFFLTHVDAAPLAFVIRIYLGAVWLQAGVEKLLTPGWTQGGLALKGFWAYATQPAYGPYPQIEYPWYRDMLQFMLAHHWYAWFAWVIAIAETSVGICLLFGLFTGLAAFAGGSLNLLYLSAGSAGANPIMLILSIFLVLARKVAGQPGMDRVVPAVIAARVCQLTRRGSETGERRLAALQQTSSVQEN